MSHSNELKAQEEFNFALFQYNPEPIIVVDRSGCVVKSNLARRAMDAPLPALGKPLFDSQAQGAERELAEALQRCIRTAEVQRCPDLQLGDRWHSVTMAPFPEGAVVVIVDRTAQIRAEAEATDQREQLIQADKMIALGTLVSGVAHEISNPNNAMLLSASALKKLCEDVIPILDRYQELEGDFEIGFRDYSEVREELPDLVDVVSRAAKRIKDFVDDLKAFARKGPSTLDESVDLNAVLDAAAHLLGSLIRKSTHHFATDQDVSLPPVRGNAQRLEQVVINLLSNACQAIPDTTCEIVAATYHDAASGVVVLTVRDTGPGIAPDVLARIKDPFFTTKHDSGGTGLGLSISNAIIAAHGGELAFTSTVGEGTIATIRLPCTGEPAATDNQDEKGASSS